MLRARDVVRLHMGHVTMPPETLLAGAAVVVTAFLIRHPSGPVLLDTGLAVGHAEAENLYHPVRRPFDGVLADAGVRAAEVKVIANCHLHLDHSGNNFRFPGVPIFAQKPERDAAGSIQYTLPSAAIDFPGARIELLDGEEAEPVPGIRIVPTPGHTPGHQSFVVETQEGRIVIAGQAFDDAAAYARALFAWRLDRDGVPHPEYAPWVARLQDFDPWRVTFAHDLAIWERGA